MIALTKLVVLESSVKQALAQLPNCCSSTTDFSSTTDSFQPDLSVAQFGVYVSGMNTFIYVNNFVYNMLYITVGCFRTKYCKIMLQGLVCVRVKDGENRFTAELQYEGH